MYRSIIYLSLLLCCEFVSGIDVFHEGSKITFHPNDGGSGYFGYSVSLSSYGLVVGAPKAVAKMPSSVSSGLVYNCPLKDTMDASNVTCNVISLGSSRYLGYVSFLDEMIKDDMWFGATIAPMSKNKLLICAPRWLVTYKRKHYLANGVCFLHKNERDWILYPLRDMDRQAFVVNGDRIEYGEYGVHVNFYAYGQAGMSTKVTEDNYVIVGAPGLLQWTGGIVSFKYSQDEESSYISKQTTSNPYYTRDLEPYSYFGYSVESGIFEPNGSVLYVSGGPRAHMGYGEVLVFKPVQREKDPLSILAKLVGPHLGAYFGASLCCTDIDGDGRSDLLVGAPTYVKKDGGLPFDQGAVFVYMTREKDSSFVLEEAGMVLGSGESGAHFGIAIADLGDIDGDGYKDIAIGAPWEDEGTGAVYIYKGHKKGLRSNHIQRISPEGARSFGMSISKGYDVDNNNCSDLAVGAHESAEVYLFRCIPSMDVHAQIEVPDAINLPQNTTEFTALACIEIPDKPLWRHVKLYIKSRIIVDPEQNRAQVSGDSETIVVARPGDKQCTERTIAVKPTADLSTPISLKHELVLQERLKKDSREFLYDAARLSEESTLRATFLLQILRDCGNDLICLPWLKMTLEPLTSPYVPGTDDKLGFKLKILNTEEPAYGAKVNITLPSAPKRVPSECSLEDLIMNCDVPAPLLRNEEIVWEVELEYTEEADKFIVEAELADLLYRTITDDASKELTIDVNPVANFSISGNQLPNITIHVSRDKLNDGEMILFTHFYKITNYGSSNWHVLDADIIIPEKIELIDSLEGCHSIKSHVECGWSVPAMVSMPVILNLRFNLSKHGDFLQSNNNFNVTTAIVLRLKDLNKSFEITTTLILEPVPPIWPQIVGSVVGFIVLAAIVFGLYKAGFFSRKQRDQLKLLQDETQSGQETLEHVNDEIKQSTSDLLEDT